MRRRVDPAGATPADGVFLWREHPGNRASEAELEVWYERFDAWCEANGVDSTEVTIEATRLGLTDLPWNPDEDL